MGAMIISETRAFRHAKSRYDYDHGTVIGVARLRVSVSPCVQASGRLRVRSLPYPVGSSQRGV